MKNFLLLTVLLYYVIAILVNCKDCGNAGNPLFLTPLIETGDVQNARRLSRVHGTQFGCNTESYSGFITINKKFNRNLFFWFFRSQNRKAPVLLWLNGGPGVSSMIGIFLSNGPFIVMNNLKLECRTFSWAKRFSMLYVDSPVGTGFSFTDSKDGFPTTTSDVTEGIYSLLRQVSEVFPEIRNNDFYGVGESYCGKYLSSLGYKLHTRHAKFVNFKGVAIGNGFIDPFNSLDYGPFLYEIGVIDEKQFGVFEHEKRQAQSFMRSGEFLAAADTVDSMIFGNADNSEPSYFQNFTGSEFIYNLRYTVDPVNYDPMTQFLNSPETRRSLHVGCKEYILEGNGNVTLAMRSDLQKSYKNQFAVVIDNYKVMLYSGNLDQLLPPPIGMKFLHSLNWKYHKEYSKSSQRIWKVTAQDKEVAGYVRQVYNFYQVIVRNAGHSAVGDQPRVGFNLITNFVNGKWEYIQE